MKVLHVTQNYYPSLGGTQHTMKKISECLHAQYNDKVTVITTNSLYGPNNATFKKIEEKETFINGVHVKRFGFFRAHKPLLKLVSKASVKMSGKGLPESVATLSMGPFSASMKKAIETTDADIICASSVHYRFADYGLYRKNIPNPKPFVLYGALHLETGQVPAKYIQRIKAADHYIANTLYEKEFLIKQGMQAAKITVAGAATDILEQEIHYDEDVRKASGINADKKIILCISRQEAFKGLPVLIDAFSQLQQEEKNSCLVIAGAKGTYSSALQEAAKNIQNLFVLTDIPQHTKCMLLQAAAIVVLPSKEESFGVVFLEAWSFKKPVIGTRIGAIASLIEENKDGYLFEPGNVSELAMQIKRMISDNNKAQQMGAAGFEKVQQHYTWDKITATFRAAYIQAIETFHQQKN
ncbi:glycosyltransferase family 4 protein [Panacibacter ginsenosidivorans]|uniref:Glycosyltransferase family 4 protein n=1 Tax=Panacibacter ginsenosidivorans TaxID=1813871 RepID=A0A5B8VCR5_9BACT|nr:glycosyltransferase family 4 protein [Panacibacter ginsenosidivorans]QEC69092.1 glycosyltransferase family 4 protein [Panacibacter ginsenosidivorans]